MHQRTKAPFANIYWFPFAALFSAIILPWSIAGQFGWLPAPAGLSYPWGHGHEMIFGFALAVIAGYTLGPQSKPYVATIISTWLLARISFALWPASPYTTLLNLAFLALLLWKILPVFIRAAKRWRNSAVGLVIIGLSIALLAFHWYMFNRSQVLLGKHLLFEAILLLSGLMFFMGGRMIGPAIAIHLKSKDIIIKDKVQTNLEGYVLILLALLLLLNLLPYRLAEISTAALLIACAAIACLRLYRWQAWHCYDRPDVLALLSGYSWLIAGWVVIAYSLLSHTVPLTIAFHTITIGALGTLTFTVMARGRMHRTLTDPNAFPWFFLFVPLIAIAALLRLSVFWFSTQQAFFIAAACWGIAFFSLFILLVYLTMIPPKKWERRLPA